MKYFIDIIPTKQKGRRTLLVLDPIVRHYTRDLTLAEIASVSAEIEKVLKKKHFKVTLDE